MLFRLCGIVNSFVSEQLVTHFFSGLMLSIKAPCASEKLPLGKYLCIFNFFFFFLTCLFKEGKGEGLQWSMADAGSPAMNWEQPGGVGLCILLSVPAGQPASRRADKLGHVPSLIGDEIKSSFQ